MKGISFSNIEHYGSSLFFLIIPFFTIAERIASTVVTLTSGSIYVILL
jgi:hypothetical protein